MTEISSNLFSQICSKVSNKLYFDDLMSKQQSSFDIQPYKIVKFYSAMAKKIYSLCQFKYEVSKELQPNPDLWYENERKLFIWFIVCYFYELKIQDANEDSINWKIVSETFFGKSIALLKFQFHNILKNKHRISWTPQEDQLLAQAVAHNGEGCWNDISKHVFLCSGQIVFKTPKHCRERWLNHLDQSKNKGRWTDQEDYKVYKFVKEHGKKWSRISDSLNHTRTQHMVKNRFNSLMAKFRKNKKQKQIFTINKILRHLEASLGKIDFNKENPANLTLLVQSGQNQQINQEQQKQMRSENSESLQRQKQIFVSSQFFGNFNYQETQKNLTTIKIQTKLDNKFLQNGFMRDFMPNQRFQEQPAIFCYGFLPAHIFQEEQQFSTWSFPKDSQPNINPFIRPSPQCRIQPVYIIRQNFLLS